MGFIWYGLKGRRVVTSRRKGGGGENRIDGQVDGWIDGRKEEWTLFALDQQIALQHSPHQGSDVRGQGSRPPVTVCPSADPHRPLLPFSAFLLPYSPSPPKRIPRTFSFFITLFPLVPTFQ